MKKILLVISFAGLVAGCATISEEACLAGSWESLGYEDGSKGESRGYFNKVAETCAKHGVIANATEYKIGYDQGLPLYCTYDKGFSHGEYGNAVHQECQAISAGVYLDGYAEGRVVYGIRQEYETLIEVFDKTKESILYIDRKLLEDGITDTERAIHLRNRRAYRLELDDNLIDIRAFERVQGWPKGDFPIPPRPRA